LALECARKTLQSNDVSLTVVVVTRDGAVAANTANGS
jgi:hypothetical protein